MAVNVIDAGAAPRALPLKRHVAAAVAGNALEFYDFLTYAFFAVYIGEAFFPSTNPTSSLLLSLATFGAGFITRPIGGVVLGSLGDRVGRRPAMFLSFSLMGIAILGVACTPSYASIGVAAPILVLFFRLLQGFALGGEVGPTTAFLVEAPPPERRGFYGSLQIASQYVAVTAAGLVASVLAVVLDPAALASWGWRVAFLMGAITVPLGLFVRSNLPETLESGTAVPDAAPRTPELMRRHAGAAVLGFLMLAGATISAYVILFMATYAMTMLHMSARLSFGATLIIGICGTVFAALGGLVSDRVGRRPVMIAAAVMLLVFTVPAFMLLNHAHTGAVLFAAVAVLSASLTFGAPIIVTVTESMPRRIRSGAVATIYAVSIAVFGGTTQFDIAWLMDWTGDPIAPAYYMTAAVVVALVAILMSRETAPLAAVSAGAERINVS